MWERGLFMDAARAGGIEVVRLRLGVDGKMLSVFLEKLNQRMKDNKQEMHLVLYLQYDTKNNPCFIQEIKHAVAVRMLPRRRGKDKTDPHASLSRKFSEFPIDQYRVIDSDSRKEWPLTMYPLMSSVTTVYAVRLKAGT